MNKKRRNIQLLLGARFLSSWSTPVIGAKEGPRHQKQPMAFGPFTAGNAFSISIWFSRS